MAPALPVPSLRLAFEAVLFARPASVQVLIAAVSAAVNEAAFAPPVPSLVIAAIASAGMVREDGAVTPARTVATFVVLRTEADVMPKTARSRIADVFMTVEGICCRMYVTRTQVNLQNNKNYEMKMKIRIFKYKVDQRSENE